MNRMMQRLMIGGVALALATAGFAQGGRGPGWCRQMGGCPRGWNCPNPAGGGGWWTRLNPTDPKQKAFVEEIGKLHNQIRDAQFALRALEAAKADTATIEARKTELNTLRNQLCELQNNNMDLKQQIMQSAPRGRGFGRGWGRGGWCWADCPVNCGVPACGICPNCPYTK